MRLSIRELAVFSMLGALMYASKELMEVLPNVHLIGAFIVTFTIVYRRKALWPIYIFVFLVGLMNGFSLWWIPYLYIWTILWGAVMLLPKQLPSKYKALIYMLVCSAHGFLYGTLYAPAQAVLFGLDFHQTIAWIIAGLPWDCIHGISNFICGALIVPLSNVILKIEAKSRR